MLIFFIFRYLELIFYLEGSFAKEALSGTLISTIFSHITSKVIELSR